MEYNNLRNSTGNLIIRIPVRMNLRRMNIITGNGDVAYRECTFSHQKCTSSLGGGSESTGMHIFTGNAYPHREWISSPRMYIVYTGWLSWRLFKKRGLAKFGNFGFSEHVSTQITLSQNK